MSPLVKTAVRSLAGVAVTGVFLGGLVLAIDYQVDSEGGPLNLGESVAAAFSTWQGVEGVTIEANVTENAQNSVRYGGGDDFGPETYSLTVQRTEGDTRSVEVLLNPTLEPQNELRRRALLHETGVLAGLSTLSNDDEGVMNPFFATDAAANLSQADRAAIAAFESFAAEDVNRDGVVDFYDLSDLAAAFGQSGVGVEGDIDGDGVVGDDDLTRLREAYVFDEPAQSAPASGSSETGGATGGDEFEDEFGSPVEDFGVSGGSETGGAF